MAQTQPPAYDLENPSLVSAMDECPLWSAPFGLKLLEILRMQKKMTVLDIGPGTGFPLLETAMRLGRDSLVTGIDPWKAAAARAVQKIRATGIPNASMIRGFAEHLPFKANRFDLILSNNGINNVLDMAETFKECSRVLKPGGQFAWTMNLEGTMSEFYDVFKETLFKNGMGSLVESVENQIHSKRKPLDEVADLLSESGMRINRIVRDSFVLRYASGSAMMGHFMIRQAFLDPWRSIVPEGRRDSVFGQIENTLNDMAEKNGELRMTVPFAVLDCTTE
ncbi:class I SAM-dependent methyltransferase [bacterium]|nr:class I SAM-dependent methyltransferase [bacterium]